MSSNSQLRHYADVVRLWSARMDTSQIAARLKLPEHVVARWVSNFREVTREGRVDLAIQAGASDA